MKTVRVGVVQATTPILRLNDTIDKAVALIKQAAEGGAQLILFPEAFVGGYPWGLTMGTRVGGRTQAGRDTWARYWQGCLSLPSPAAERLAQAAREVEAYVVMGAVEKSARGGTLYCTVLYFGPDGTLLGKHRKLKPTAAERLIWGEGEGSTLTVIDTPFGRVGGLICWEHYMPLARAAMLAQGIDIWVAPTMDERDVWQCTIRHLAKEGRCFVLSAVQYLTRDMYPEDLPCRDELDGLDPLLCDGGSAIVGPLGDYLVQPLRGKEGILSADLPLDDLAKSRFDFDPIGHYARPDVFELHVDEREKTGYRARAEKGEGDPD